MNKSNNKGEKTLENYTRQMQEGHAFMIDKNFWMVVRPKPWWMPAFLYKMVIKNLIEFNEYK